MIGCIKREGGRRAHAAAAAAALFKCRASSDKVLANGSVGEVLAREHFEKVLPAADCMNMYLLEGEKNKESGECGKWNYARR